MLYLQAFSLYFVLTVSFRTMKLYTNVFPKRGCPRLFFFERVRHKKCIKRQTCTTEIEDEGRFVRVCQCTCI